MERVRAYKEKFRRFKVAIKGGQAKISPGPSLTPALLELQPSVRGKEREIF